jgi:DHA1 family bicyclomycin/chloramphenicol resistance-like MFS transporter
LQGIGVAAGPAIARAIVRDQFTGQASARILNLIGTMLAIGPALAPTIGGVILSTLGWQPIFGVFGTLRRRSAPFISALTSLASTKRH